MVHVDRADAAVSKCWGAPHLKLELSVHRRHQQQITEDERIVAEIGEGHHPPRLSHHIVAESARRANTEVALRLNVMEPVDIHLIYCSARGRNKGFGVSG